MTTKTSWKQGKFWRWPAISLVVFLFAGGLFLVQLTQANPTSGRAYPAPSSDYISPLENDINTYREMLNNGHPDEQMRRSLEEKLAMTERLATQMAPGQPPRNPDQTPELFPYTAPPFQTGIIVGQGAEFRPSEARIQNRWLGIVNGEYVVVFAGSPANDPEQGILYIRWIDPDTRGTTGGGSYPTPEKSGSVRIVQAEEPGWCSLRMAGETFISTCLWSVRVSLTEIALTPTPALYPYP
jgi:hypothetical protein